MSNKKLNTPAQASHIACVGRGQMPVLRGRGEAVAEDGFELLTKHLGVGVLAEDQAPDRVGLAAACPRRDVHDGVGGMPDVVLVARGSLGLVGQRLGHGVTVGHPHRGTAVTKPALDVTVDLEYVRVDHVVRFEPDDRVLQAVAVDDGIELVQSGHTSPLGCADHC